MMLPCCLWGTCPIHLHRLQMMMVSMLSWLEWARCCWLEMVSGKKLCRILLRFFVRKVGNLFRSHSVILQHSKPYNRVERTQFWYSPSLVLVLYWDDLQTLFIILKAFLAWLRQFFMLLPAPPSCLTMLPRQVNSSIVGRCSLFPLTGAGCCTFSIMTSAFFWLIFRPICCAKVLTRDVFSCMC